MSLINRISPLALAKVPVFSMVFMLPMWLVPNRSPVSTQQLRLSVPVKDAFTHPTYYVVTNDKDPEHLDAEVAEANRTQMITAMNITLHDRVRETSVDFEHAEKECDGNYPCEVVEEVVTLDNDRPVYHLGLRLKLKRSKQDRGVTSQDHPSDLGGIPCTKSPEQSLTYCHHAQDGWLAKDLSEHDQNCHRTAEPLDPKLCLEAGLYRESP